MNLQNRATKGLSGIAVVCLAAVLLSSTVQVAHVCAVFEPQSQAAIAQGPPASSSPVCLICLMAPSIGALVLLVAFFILSGSTMFVGSLQMRPKPILYFSRLYIRPPPPGLV